MSDNLDPERFDDGDTNIKFSDLYIPREILGNGAFGIVVSVQSKQDYRQYAVKVVNKKTLKKEKCNNFLKEAEILSQLNHPNIVKFINIIETETRILMVMELVRGGTLMQLITDRVEKGNLFSDEEAAIIMRSIFSAMQYIHAEGIVHRDLKPENILLKDKNDLSSIKICDFGLSAQFEENDQGKYFLDTCGTRLYMAPELWNKKLYSKPVDLYSCGIILYLLLSGGRHPLWTGKDTISSYKHRVENPNWNFPSTFTSFSKHLFLKLVDLSPVERYTSDQAGTHPWITRKFSEPIPMTSSEHIRAFRQTQTFTYMIKALYMIECKMKTERTRVDVDNDHKKKIREFDSKFVPANKPTISLEPNTIGSTLKNILASFQIVQENNKELEPEPKTPPRKANGSTPQAPKTDPEGRPKSRGFLSPRANPTISPFSMSKKNSENLPPRIKPMQPSEGEPQKFNLKRSFTNLHQALSADKANNISNFSSDEEKVLKPQNTNNVTSFILTKEDEINKTSIEINLNFFNKNSNNQVLKSELLDREPDHVKDFSFTVCHQPDIASANDIVKQSSDFIKAIDDELPDYKVMKPPKPRRLSSIKNKKEKSTKSKENSGIPPLPKPNKVSLTASSKPNKIVSAARKRSEPPPTAKKRRDNNTSNISFVRDDSPYRAQSNFIIPTSPAVKIVTAIQKPKEKGSNSANSSLVLEEFESKTKRIPGVSLNILSEIDPQVQIHNVPRRAGQISKRGRGTSQTPSEGQRNSSLTFLKNKRAVLYDQPDGFNVSKVSILPMINGKKS